MHVGRYVGVYMAVNSRKCDTHCRSQHRIEVLSFFSGQSKIVHFRRSCRTQTGRVLEPDLASITDSEGVSLDDN